MAKKNIKKPAIDDLQVLREAALISARQRVVSAEHKEELWQRSKRKLESPPKHHSPDSGNVTPKMYDAGGDVTPPHPLCDTPNDTPPRAEAVAPKFTVKVGSHMPLKRSLSKEPSPAEADKIVIDSEAISPEPQFEHYETVKKPSPPKKITIKLLAEDQVKVPVPQSPSYSTITSDGLKSESDTEKPKEKCQLPISEDKIEQEEKLSKKSKRSDKPAKSVKPDKKERSSKRKDKPERKREETEVVMSSKNEKDKENSNGHVSKKHKKRHSECEVVKEKIEEVEESPKKIDLKALKELKEKLVEERKEKKRREERKEEKRDSEKRDSEKRDSEKRDSEKKEVKRGDKQEDKPDDKQEEKDEELICEDKREDISDMSDDEPEIVSLKTKRHYEQMKAEQNRTMPPKPKSKEKLKDKESRDKDSSKSNGKSSSKSADKKSSKDADKKARKEMKISKKEERELLGETKEKKREKFESVMKDEDSSSGEVSDNMDSLLKSNVDLSLDELVMKPKIPGDKRPRDDRSDKKKKDKKEKKEKKHKKKHKKTKDDDKSEKSEKSEKSDDKKSKTKAEKTEKKKKRRKESTSESEAETSKKPKVKIDKAELNKIVQFLKQRDEAQRDSTASKGPFNPKIITKENKPIEIKLKTKPRR